MPCLFAIIAALSPRLGVILLWIFTEYVTIAFNGWPVQPWLWALLGTIFLPWTTLLYLLVAAPLGGITFWGWMFVGMGLVLDVGAFAQAYRERKQIPGMAQA